MRITAIILLITTAFNVMAQPPLNKRLQKEKEEFEALIAAEKKYEALMKEADSAFQNKNYVDARMAYEEAIQYNVEKEQWLISKVNDLDILMAKNAARQVDSILVSMPSRTSQIGENDDKPVSQLEKRNVKADKPVVSQEPEDARKKDETIEIDVVSNSETTAKPEEVADKPKVEVPKKQNQPTDKSAAPTKKVKEDFSNYDNGITEETFHLDNHVVDRIVVKDGIDVMVFKKVKHNWGGEFYFLDGVGTTQRYWMEQVKKYRQKFTPSDE